MPGGLTTNGSVRWFIEALKPERETDKGLNRSRLDGKDGTRKGDFLKVAIRMPSDPQNRTKFIDQLREQLNQAGSANLQTVTFYLPLEDNNNGYKPGEGNRPVQSDDLTVELDEGEWQIYFDWSKTKFELPINFQNGWVYGDKSAI